jgi:hypothetical protein
MGAHRGRQVACLSALALLVLAIGSIAVAALAPGPHSGVAGAIIGAATGNPSATPARADVRLLAVPASTGSAEYDVHASHPLPHRLVHPVDGWPAQAVTSDLILRSHVPAHPGRAPPQPR